LFEGYAGNAGTNPVNLSDLKGKVVVLNFWASWCIPCAEEAEDLQAVYEQYKDKGVVFLGVDWTDIEGDALNYLKRFGITYANGPDLQTKIGPLYHQRCQRICHRRDGMCHQIVPSRYELSGVTIYCCSMMQNWNSE
jgi:thiol-disulfide isomerase/thioredoxin